MKVSNIKWGGKMFIKFMVNCFILKFFIYNRFVSEFQKIDIGKVYLVKEYFFFDNEDDDNVSGCYWDLWEYLFCFVVFYFIM